MPWRDPPVIHDSAKTSTVPPFKTPKLGSSSIPACLLQAFHLLKHSTLFIPQGRRSCVCVSVPNHSKPFPFLIMFLYGHELNRLNNFPKPKERCLQQKPYFEQVVWLRGQWNPSHFSEPSSFGCQSFSSIGTISLLGT